jgi:dolichol-phosphate mannosyltransferase
MHSAAAGGSTLRKPVEISVIAPVYKCRECIPELHRQLVEALSPLVPSFEIVLVDDGCLAGSWSVIQSVAAADPRVKAIGLSRNFGQHYAIAAGLHHSSGNWVVVMDCDLQDRPSEIPNLYRKALEGYDIVYAQRQERQDSWFKRALSRGFSMVYNLLSDIPIDPRVANFSIAARPVIDGYCKLKEMNRSYHLNLRWLGYRSAYLPVEHASRFAGATAYSLRRGFRLAIESITSQSNKPLILAMRAGFLMSGSALLVALFYVVEYLRHGITVSGFTSLIVSVYFIGGLILANMGVLGLYLGKVFNEVKERPLYIVRETINFDV